jgi:hypothetical protein
MASKCQIFNSISLSSCSTSEFQSNLNRLHPYRPPTNPPTGPMLSRSLSFFSLLCPEPTSHTYGISYLSPSHHATSTLSLCLTEPESPLVLVPFLLAVFVRVLRADLVSNTWRAQTRRRLPEPTGHTCTRPLATRLLSPIPAG